jgi:AbrB family looped-hinge helix DNA binding protein
MSAAILTHEGQITLPAHVRKQFGLEAGDRLFFFRALSGDLRLHISRKRVGAGRGGIKGGGRLDRQILGEAVSKGVAGRRTRPYTFDIEASKDGALVLLEEGSA